MKRILLGVLLLMGTLSFSHALTDSQEGVLLESLGNSVSTGAYSMYIAIGGVADLYGKDIYKAKTAKAILTALARRCGRLSDYLTKLIDRDVVTGSDVSFLQGVIDTYDELGAEAKGYVEYIDDISDENFDAYNGHRKKAWKGIEKMMGWDED